MLGLGLGLTNFGTRGGVSDVPDALSGASSLLDGEDGLAIDFSDQSIAIRDTTTPANNIASAGTVRNGALVGPGAKITYTSPSPKLCKRSDGTYGYRAQNLYLNSEAPAKAGTPMCALPGHWWLSLRTCLSSMVRMAICCHCGIGHGQRKSLD